MRPRSSCAASALLALGLVAPPGPARAAQGEIAPGAYCPLPEPGEAPKCLDPAQQTYGDFFSALEADDLDARSFAQVEETVGQGASAEHAYLALSSLAYGYYRLASRTAVGSDSDPAVVERLARWNDLLSNAYAGSPEDRAYQAAVRQAAEDLHARAPIALPCLDAQGTQIACNSTEGVLRGFNAASERVGLRGALERVMRRLLGPEAP